MEKGFAGRKGGRERGRRNAIEDVANLETDAMASTFERRDSDHAPRLVKYIVNI